VAAHPAEESLPAVEQLGTVRRLRQLEVVERYQALVEEQLEELRG